MSRVANCVRQGAHWCDFQRHVALFNSLFYYIKAHIFDKNRHFLRKKSKMCAFEFGIFNHPVVLQVIFFRTNFCPFETERSFRRYFTMNSNSSWEELRKEVLTMIFLYSLF